MERVIIWHPETRGAAIVSQSAVPVWEKRGWQVLDANAPKPTVLEAAEKLGVTVDPSATRSQLVETMAPAPHPDDPDNPEG